MVALLAIILLVLGYSFLAFGTLASVGYGLYLWAVADVAFKVALWTTFITWVKLMIAGFVSFIAGSLLGATLHN